MIGIRLKEERVRLGFNQESFAAAAGVTRRPYADWEAGKTSPTTVQLASLASTGADVLYILTGRREAEALSTEEKLLIERYRVAEEATRYRILISLLEGKAPEQATPDSKSVTQVITSVIGGQVAGRQIKNKE